MKKILQLTIIAILALGIASCSETTGMSKQQTGTLVGGAAGAAAGAALFGGSSQIYGVIGGALIGALLGSAIGHSMDKQDAQNALAASINTPVGKEAIWTNKKTGKHYTVRPVKEYTSGSAYCRKAKIYVEPEKKVYNTVVCRGKDGKWYIKS